MRGDERRWCGNLGRVFGDAGFQGFGQGLADRVIVGLDLVADDGADGGVEAGAVTAAGENPDFELVLG